MEIETGGDIAINQQPQRKRNEQATIVLEASSLSSYSGLRDEDDPTEYTKLEQNKTNEMSMRNETMIAYMKGEEIMLLRTHKRNVIKTKGEEFRLLRSQRTQHEWSEMNKHSKDSQHYKAAAARFFEEVLLLCINVYLCVSSKINNKRKKSWDVASAPHLATLGGAPQDGHTSCVR